MKDCRRIAWAVGIIAPLLILGIFLATKHRQTLHPLTVQASNGETRRLEVEWAKTPQESEKGLMNRPVVDHGMLFFFDEPTELTFWMKNTLVPLDIYFFDASKHFVSWAPMVPCTADPCPLYGSQAKAAYALEVPSGFLQGLLLDKNLVLQP